MATQHKIAIILQAGAEGHEGMARALHALLYAKELHDTGHEVRLIFDGAGTTWVAELQKPEHRMHPLFTQVRERDCVYAVCDFCSGAFGVKDKLGPSASLLRGDAGGHPSFAALIAEGFQPVIL